MQVAPDAPHLLFVDDEPRVVQGLRRVLMVVGRSWRVQFAAGGEEAVARLASDRFDVVVSDMRMPKVDGVAVLDEARRRQPRTVRIVLSGEMDTGEVTNAFRVAHMFLAKPTDPRTLDAAISGALTAASGAPENDVMNRLLETSSWIAQAEVLDRLRAATPDQEGEILARAVADDVTIAAAVLRLASSGLVGARDDVTDPDAALRQIGPGRCREFILGADIVRAADADEGLRQVLRDINTAVTGRPPAERLRGFGQVALLQADARYATSVQNGGQETCEQSESGLRHRDVAAHLLAYWGTARTLVEEVRGDIIER